MAMRLLLGDNQHEYTDNQIDYLVGINIFGSSLSLLGALFVITNYWTFTSLRKNFAFKLIYWIAVSDLILAISNCMGAPPDGSGICYSQAILQQFGQISSVGWVVSISWSIQHLTTLTKLPTKDELNNLRKKMHIVIWTVSIITTVLPFTTKSYGVAGGWCWIKGYESIDIMWRYLCFYVPLWCAIIYMIIIYVKVWKRLNSINDIQSNNNDNDDSASGDELASKPDIIDDGMDDQIVNQYSSDKFPINDNNDNDNTKLSSSNIINNNSKMKSDEEIEERVNRKKNNTLQRMKFYPMILIICYFWATTRRIIDWATADQTPFFLAVLHTFFAAIPGFLDAIVYGLTKDVKQKDIQFMRKYCCKSEKHLQLKNENNYEEEQEIINKNDQDDDNL